MKYRQIDYGNGEIDIITEEGGVASIREVEDFDEGDGRTAVTDYYSNRITELEGVTEDNLFDLLSEGKMYYQNWFGESYDDDSVIRDALDWFENANTEWERDDTLFSDLIPQ